MNWAWTDLQTLGGSPAEIPDLVGELLSPEAGVRDSAYQQLAAQVANQGTLYSAAAGVTDLLVSRLQSEGELSAEAWLLLNDMFRGDTYGAVVVVEGLPVSLEDYVYQRIVSALPQIEHAVETITVEQLCGMSLLLMALAETSFSVVEAVERATSAATGRRSAALADILAEVREAWLDGQASV